MRTLGILTSGARRACCSVHYVETCLRRRRSRGAGHHRRPLRARVLKRRDSLPPPCGLSPISTPADPRARKIGEHPESAPVRTRAPGGLCRQGPLLTGRSAADMTPTKIAVATELRDGLLQDLVALGLMLKIAERSLQPGAMGAEATGALATAGSTVQTNLERLRSVIERLGGPR